MGYVQITYAQDVLKGYPGQLADLSDRKIESKAVETAAIPFGLAVQLGTSANQVIKAAAAPFFGMTVRTHENANADGQYEVAEAANIMTEGKIYASVDGTGAAGAALTFITTTGQLSTAAADGTHIATTCTLDEAQTVADAIVKVKVG